MCSLISKFSSILDLIIPLSLISLLKWDYKSKAITNKSLIEKYFPQITKPNDQKIKLFNDYLSKFYHFCFELSPENVIKEAINFKV